MQILFYISITISSLAIILFLIDFIAISKDGSKALCERITNLEKNSNKLANSIEKNTDRINKLTNNVNELKKVADYLEKDIDKLANAEKHIEKLRKSVSNMKYDVAIDLKNSKKLESSSRYISYELNGQSWKLKALIDDFFIKKAKNNIMSVIIFLLLSFILKFMQIDDSLQIFTWGGLILISLYTIIIQIRFKMAYYGTNYKEAKELLEFLLSKDDTNIGNGNKVFKDEMDIKIIRNAKEGVINGQI